VLGPVSLLKLDLQARSATSAYISHHDIGLSIVLVDTINLN
jgi:hypothetical protein